jgi:hypothetical protein
MGTLFRILVDIFQALEANLRIACADTCCSTVHTVVNGEKGSSYNECSEESARASDFFVDFSNNLHNQNTLEHTKPLVIEVFVHTTVAFLGNSTDTLTQRRYR